MLQVILDAFDSGASRAQFERLVFSRPKKPKVHGRRLKSKAGGMSLLALALTAILVTSAEGAGAQTQPAQTSQASSPEQDGSSDSGQGPKPLNLPVSLDRIREALQQPPPQALKGLNEPHPQFRVEITERQKLDDLVKSLKFDSGPPVPGGLYAYEQQQVLFPKVDNPLVQPYAAFNQSQLLWVSLTSLIERYLAGKLVSGVEGANRAAADAAAKQEVERAIAEYCSAQPNGGPGIRICSEPLR